MGDEKAQTLANSLYVSHFPIPMNEERLMKLFKPFGPVREVVLKYSSIHSDWGPSHAFIHFQPPDGTDDNKTVHDADAELNPAVAAAIAALNGEGGNETIKRMLEEEGKTDERWRSEKLEVKTRTINPSKAPRRPNRSNSRSHDDRDDRGPRPMRVIEPPERKGLRRPPPPIADEALRDERDYRRDRRRSPDRYGDVRDRGDRYDHSCHRRRDYSPRRRSMSPPPRRRSMSPPQREMRRPPPDVRDDRRR